MIAAAIAVDEAAGAERALEDARHARAQGASIVEWRVDALAQEAGALETIARLVREAPLPCIVTIRRAEEGGDYRDLESERLDLLLEVAGLDPAPSYVDLELASFRASKDFRDRFAAAAPSTRLILSVHDFASRPADLHARVAAMWAEPLCAVAKVAWRARSVRDNLEAFELLRGRHKPTIALCMGPFGAASRALAGKFGGFLTYARVDHDPGTAPGQPTVRELATTLRAPRVAAATRVFGVVGWPVERSLSPLLHNAAFEAAGVDGAYTTFAVPPEWEHFKASVGELFDSALLQLGGISVTIPHKEHALRWCRERGGAADAASEWAGAANTLVRAPSGAVAAANTDAPAAVAALAAGLGIDERASASLASGAFDGGDSAASAARNAWTRRSVLVLGAGGAARAVAAGLALAGADVVVANRTRERAQRLAESLHHRDAPAGHETRVQALDLDRLGDCSFDAIVNATSAGMAGGGAESTDPLPPEVACAPGVVVMDAVYRPLQTPLLRRARAAGATTIDGAQMLLRQAALQFALFTGREAPLAAWGALLARALEDGA